MGQAQVAANDGSVPKTKLRLSMPNISPCSYGPLDGRN
jgi:hypothetical protein